MKRVKIGKMSKKEVSDALNEIRFLASIRHKNIVGFLEAFLGTSMAIAMKSYCAIVMCYCHDCTILMYAMPSCLPYPDIT
jgi:serine/threonine protein kinase